MRFSKSIAALSVATSVALFTGCTGNSTVAPKPLTPQGHTIFFAQRIPAALSPIGLLRVNIHNGDHFAGFDSCPATGALTYISDFNNSVVNIYAGGTFASQSPCGILTGFINPQGLFISPGSHNLYVANTGGGNVLVFHRGATSPFQTYTDTTGQYPVDVAVSSPNGNVIASNIFAMPPSTELGSISTWPRSGQFSHNYKMINDTEGLFVTVQNGPAVRIYYNDIDSTSGAGVVYKGNCPGAVCGVFSPTPASADTVFPGGLRSRNADTRLVQIDQSGGVGGARIKYNLPGFTSPTPCNLNGSDPVGFDMNTPTSRIYYADAGNNNGVELNFTCGFVGTVPGNAGGLMIGVAHDPPEAL